MHPFGATGDCSAEVIGGQNGIEPCRKMRFQRSAPKHAESFRAHVVMYDGVPFHRVVDEFVSNGD